MIDTQVNAKPFVARSASASVTSREKGMRVFQIDPLQDPRWKDFIESHPDASLFHRVEWLKALKASYGYTPIALTLTAPGSPLGNGIAFCEIRSWLTGNRLVSVPFSDHCEPLVGDSEEMKGLLAGMVETTSKDRWKYAEIRPVELRTRHQSQFRDVQHVLFAPVGPAVIGAAIIQGVQQELGSTKDSPRRARIAALQRGIFRRTSAMLLQAHDHDPPAAWTSSPALEMVSQSDRVLRRGPQSPGRLQRNNSRSKYVNDCLQEDASLQVRM